MPDSVDKLCPAANSEAVYKVNDLHSRVILSIFVTFIGAYKSFKNIANNFVVELRKIKFVNLIY